MTTASLDISPRPELVRTARMMSVSLGRRAGLPDVILDEVRVAVGEAVSRAVLINGRDGQAPVRIAFLEDDLGYQVDVRDNGDVAAAHEAGPGDLDDLDVEQVEQTGMPAGLDLALVAGMTDELEVEADPAGGTVVRLRWTR